MKLTVLITIIVIFFTSMGFIPRIPDQTKSTQSPTWYEGKQFNIRTLGKDFHFTTISEIIHINEYNVLLVIKIDGRPAIYIPFNKVILLLEVKEEE